MAATTIPAIIDRFQVVCEGADLNLKKSRDEFSFDLQPNARINNIYRIEESGIDEVLQLTGNVEARMDRVSVWMAVKATPNSELERETLRNRVVTLERKIYADGLTNSYHAMTAANEVQRVGDVLISRTEFTVDYDFSTT